MRGRCVSIKFSKYLLVAGLAIGTLVAQRPVGDPVTNSATFQPFQPAEACLPCHQRQYDELRQSVKSGYRNVSPLFNALELAGNFLSGGLLRPIDGDRNKSASGGTGATAGTPLRTNVISSPSFTDLNQVRAGFCLGCHNPNMLLQGEDPARREVPEIETGSNFRPDLIRPLRDYHIVDSHGQQILPSEPGGPVPPGGRRALGAAGITCDVCHNVLAPDLDRSFQRDGLANMSLALLPTINKVGPFRFPAPVRGNFHTASWDTNRIEFLRSGNFCGGCHDVRVPLAAPGNLTHLEPNKNNPVITSYRLENLNTEWETGPYNSTNNPFGKIIRCQDCHMSLFPYAGETSYTVGGTMVTSPTPGVFPRNFAALPGISTANGYLLQQRQVVTHHLTGVDVPLLYDEELRSRLGENYPPVYEPGVDEYGTPKSIAQRREDLLKAAVRISLQKSDGTAKVGGEFTVRVTAVALTGHRFPAGFSQERTAYIELTVKDKNGFKIYQSGYLVDKAHPEVGELQPDGNLDDEDLEHINAVVDPGRRTAVYQAGAGTNGHTNEVFWLGPDNGPEARLFGGELSGLVLFRNELTRIFLPGQSNGRGKIMTRAHAEETFSAGFANAVDNFRSLAPLRPTTYKYKIKLPDERALELLGVRLEGPLQVHAQVNFLHFPPLFLRFLERTTGPQGPGGVQFNLLSERRMDDLLRNVKGIASADATIEVVK